ncbi:hypothetical protein AB6H33_21875 [Providencia hangzhouensis]
MFKKSYLYIGLMMIFTSSQAIADEFEIDYDQQIIKLNQRINELEKKKSDLEKKIKRKYGT